MNLCSDEGQPRPRCTVMFIVHDEFALRLDELAEADGTCRSQLAKKLMLEALAGTERPRRRHLALVSTNALSYPYRATQTNGESR